MFDEFCDHEFLEESICERCGEPDGYVCIHCGEYYDGGEARNYGMCACFREMEVEAAQHRGHVDPPSAEGDTSEQ